MKTSMALLLLPLSQAVAIGAGLGALHGSALAAEPGFDCARASGGQVEQLVCKDPELAQLDREMNRLFDDATRSPAAKRHPQLKALQRGWIKGRNDCWKSTDARTCVRDNYVLRIAELRHDFPAPADGMMADGMTKETPKEMAKDMPGKMSKQMPMDRMDKPMAPAKGITVGPIALSCPGITGPVSVTFVNSDPGAVALTASGHTVVLGHTMSASGARYASTLPDGEHVLWNKGREYRLERPGQPAITCSDSMAAMQP